jgi:hypothetical protein
MTTPAPTTSTVTPTAGIDPRGPRFGATITAILLLVTIAVGLGNAATPPASFLTRVSEPALILLVVLTAIFAWGAFAGIARHPYGILFRKFVQPRLAPTTEREDPTPPTFAQGVGFFVALIGVGLHLVGVPYGLVAAASAAFIAAFLNSVFAYCLGCQIYLLLVRARVLGRISTAAA